MAALHQYSITTQPDGTVLVWEKGVNSPLADFQSEEEAESYVYHCMVEDRLEEEFQTFVDGIVRGWDSPET
jgi:hypothetical protein